MKRKFFVWMLIFLGILITSCSGPMYMIKKNTQQIHTDIKPLPGKASLVVFNTIGRSASGDNLLNYLDKKFIGATKGKSYIVKNDIEPGTKYLSVWCENGIAVKINFEPGKIYYLENVITSRGILGMARVGFEPNKKSMDEADLKDLTFYRIDNSKSVPDLVDEQFKDVINGAGTLIVSPDGVAKIVK